MSNIIKKTITVKRFNALANGIEYAAALKEHNGDIKTSDDYLEKYASLICGSRLTGERATQGSLMVDIAVSEETYKALEMNESFGNILDAAKALTIGMNKFRFHDYAINLISQSGSLV